MLLIKNSGVTHLFRCQVLNDNENAAALMGHSGAPRHATVSSPANYIQLIYIGGIDSLFDVWRYLCAPILPFFSFLVFLSEAEGQFSRPPLQLSPSDYAAKTRLTADLRMARGFCFPRVCWQRDKSTNCTQQLNKTLNKE